MQEQYKLVKEYLKFLNRLNMYDKTCFWGSLRLINRETVYKKRNMYQIRLCKHHLLTNFKYSL